MGPYARAIACLAAFPPLTASWSFLMLCPRAASPHSSDAFSSPRRVKRLKPQLLLISPKTASTSVALLRLRTTPARPLVGQLVEGPVLRLRRVLLEGALLLLVEQVVLHEGPHVVALQVGVVLLAAVSRVGDEDVRQGLEAAPDRTRGGSSRP